MDDDGNLSLALLFFGLTAMALYMAIRYWPVSGAGKSMTPGAYAVNILEGHPPTEGANPVGRDTGAIKLLIEGIIGLWIVKKAVSIINDAKQATVGSLLSATGPASNAASTASSGGGTLVSGGTASPLAADTALTGPNATAWATAILTGLGAPATAANVSAMIGWFGREGGGGANNPLNVSANTAGFGGTALPGSAAANGGNPIQSYPSVTNGVSATVATIKNGSYGTILADLMAGNGVGSNAASELSEWSGGGYSSV